jgi:conjugative transfer signal peptidase TraF
VPLAAQFPPLTTNGAIEKGSAAFYRQMRGGGLGTLLAKKDHMAWFVTERDASQRVRLSLRTLQKYPRRHRNGMWALLALALAAGLALAAHALDLRINWTSSMPLGLYRESPARLERGALVLICLPEAMARVGRQRRYLPLGDCPEGVSPIVKQIVAITGDEIELQEEFLAVKGVVVDRTGLRSNDSLGRPLDHVPLGRRLVADGEVWVLGSERSRSWDSRYFGAVPVESIVASAKPVLTLGSGAN